jgi:hypothetical protein
MVGGEFLSAGGMSRTDADERPWKCWLFVWTDVAFLEGGTGNLLGTVR